jgi:glycosyltransferase involved in cell wall biosynthesis
MKVVALTRTSTIGPSTRYRIGQYVSDLRQHDIHVSMRPLFGPTWFKLLESTPRSAVTVVGKALYSLSRLLVRVGQVLAVRIAPPDLVLIEQQLFPYLPAWIEGLLWPRGAPTVLEFDDAIYLTKGHRQKLERLCAQADLVIVGNRFLADFARPHARRVVEIPTTVDLARYEAARAIQRRRRDEADDVFRVGWIGLRYNHAFLDELAAPLARIAASGRPVELRVVSSSAPAWSESWGTVRIVHRPWSEDTEAEELGACDVGVMPLPDNEWARGKCALKILQCMAAAVPVVCSPVGVNADIVQEATNGMLASSAEQWQEAFARLAADLEMRARVGEAGLQTVREGYSLQKGAEKVREAYGLAAHRAEGDGESRPSSSAIRPR